MSNPFELQKYTVKLALYGIKVEQDPTAVHDIESELKMRSHICGAFAILKNDLSYTVVQVDVEGVDPEITAKQMAEELFEVACAVLHDVKGMRVELLDAHIVDH